MQMQKFFRCQKCGNMVGMIHDAGIPMICCGEQMQELVANTSDGATEKHIPVVEVQERLVYAKVGSLEHPMTEEHHIEFIYLQTKKGGQMKRLCVGKDAAAMFAVLKDAPVCVYAYCNLHGLWKADAPAQCTQHHEEQGADEEVNETICSAEFSEGCIQTHEKE